jgi:hypothetical protein
VVKNKNFFELNAFVEVQFRMEKPKGVKVKVAKAKLRVKSPRMPKEG